MVTSGKALQFADHQRRSQSLPIFTALPKSRSGGTRWVTRARPKIDRIACPWLILRCIDPQAEFLYVPAAQVRGTARDQAATPFDILDVAFSHRGDRCTFDALLEDFLLEGDDALRVVAGIVRAADTGRLNAAREAAGLLAMSLGLSRLFERDEDMLRHGLMIYDALYLWALEAREESHGWNPHALLAAAERR